MLEVQLPRVPFVGAVTAHEAPAAFTAIGTAKRTAPSHQLILSFTPRLDPLRTELPSRPADSVFAELGCIIGTPFFLLQTLRLSGS